MREFLGLEKQRMVDVNLKWTVEKPLLAVRVFGKHDLDWSGGLTIPDDIERNRWTELENPIPLGIGENVHSVDDFRQIFAEGDVPFPNADISNLGGITALLKVAHFADVYNQNLTAHRIHKMCVSCLAAVPNASFHEIHVFRIDNFLIYQPQIKDDYAYTSDRLGHGVEMA